VKAAKAASPQRTQRDTEESHKAGGKRDSCKSGEGNLNAEDAENTEKTEKLGDRRSFYKCGKSGITAKGSKGHIDIFDSHQCNGTDWLI
jgi:hypothetical protein